MIEAIIPRSESSPAFTIAGQLQPRQENIDVWLSVQHNWFTRTDWIKRTRVFGPPVDPFMRTTQGGVRCDERTMELHRPYPFQVGLLWFVAVRHSKKDGDVEIYVLEK